MTISSDRARSLQSRFLDAQDERPSIFTDEMGNKFLDFFEETVLPGIVPSTLLSYKTAIRSFIEDGTLRTRLSAMRAKPKRLQTKRTTTMRAKGLPERDLAVLEAYALKQQELNERTLYAEPTTTWLRAGVLTGLRPHEWRTARIAGDYELHVENSKLSKCIQSEWPDRIIMLDHLSADELDVIVAHMEVTATIVVRGKKSTTKNFDDFRAACGVWLLKANKALWPRRKLNINLMSSRHQFIANLKASGSYTPKEIAYLVGHVTDLRAFESYAGTSSGSTDLYLPSIPENAVEKVDNVVSKLEKKVLQTSKRKQMKDFVKTITSQHPDQ